MVRSTTARAFALGSALGLSALVAATPGAASAAPGAPEQDITRAVTASPATAHVAATDYTVGDVRVAASDPAWAAAELTPTRAAADSLDPATAVLQRTGGTWQVVDLGTAQVGCAVAGAGVLQDLALSC